MLYPVSELETVSPLGSESPCRGPRPRAGLERAEGSGLCAPGLAPVPTLQRTGRWTAHRELRLARGIVSGCL